MRDDERDPLDTWLSREVRPMPPPPGTFELITRRARRRKIRKLAVTVASAAAVAAGVAVAVPSVMALHLTPGSTDGNPVAAQGSSTAASSGTQSAEGRGTHVPSATPSASTPSSVPTAVQSGPVPDNFQPSSVTFVSQSQAWVIGQAGTPGSCHDANPYYCTSVASTSDGGHSWVGRHAPKTGPPSGDSGVSGIRFLEGKNGWAFGPQLFATHDGGQTWTQVDTHGQRVTDLETVNGRAYALWALCQGTNSSGFALTCISYTLMTTPAGSDQWTAVSGATNGLTAQGHVTSAFIALTGTTGYLVAPDGTLYSGPIGGPWVKAGTLPCEPGPPQASGLPSGAAFAVSFKHLAIACAGADATSPPAVYTSDNNGSFWTPQASSAWSGLTSIGAITSLTAGEKGMLALATTQGLYQLPSGGTHWKQVVGPASGPSGGFTYVGMTDPHQGVAVPADMQLHEVWMTQDSGVTWQSAAPIVPGN
jgi:hypothetical protein